MCGCDFVWLYLTDQRTSISWIALLVMFAESLGKSIKKRQSTCAPIYHLNFCDFRETCSCTLDISNPWNSDLFSLSEAGHYHVKWKVGSMYRLTGHLLIVQANAAQMVLQTPQCLRKDLTCSCISKLMPRRWLSRRVCLTTRRRKPCTRSLS